MVGASGERVRLRWTCVVALVLAGAAPARAETPATSPEPPPPLDLGALTRLAVESYPSLRAAAHAVEAAQQRLREARVSPFFQLEATAGVTVAPEARGTPIYSRDSQLPLDNPWKPVVAVGAEGAVPLYTFGKLRAAWDAAAAGIEAAEAGRRLALAELKRDVRKAYFALQLALDVHQLISEGRGKLAQAIERVEERLEEGDPDITTMDQWRLEAALAEVDARAAEADLLEAAAREALEILTGRDTVRIPECPSEIAELELAPLEEYVARATRRRPEAAQLEAALEAQNANLDVQQGQYFPDLALALAASYSRAPGITDQDNPFIQDRANLTTLRAGLVARWSLDVWGNVHRVRRAKAELAELRARTDQALQGIRLDVSTAYHRVLDARKREEAWARGERQTRSWFVAAGQAYQVGTLGPKDLIDAVKAYFTARFHHLEAVRDYNTALAELERTIGTPLRPDSRWQPPCE